MNLSSETPETLSRQAQAAYESGRLAEARALYARLCEQREHDVHAWHMLGAVHGMLGDFAEAERCCRRVIALKPDAYGAYMNLGQALAAQGLLTDACNVYEQALQLKPGDARMFSLLGGLSLRDGRADAAEQYFRQALALDPDDPETEGNLGIALRAQGKHAESAIHLDRAVKGRPDNADVRFHYAATCAALGDFSAAITACMEVLRLQPGHFDACLLLARARERAGRIDEALQSYERAIRMDPNRIEARLALGRALHAKGRWQEALDLCRQTLAVDPANIQAHVDMAITCYALRRPEDAQICCARVLQLDAGNAAAHNLLGLIHLDRGDTAGAEKYFTQAAELDPRAAETWCNLGFLATRQLQFDTALAHYRKALAIAPDNLDALGGEAALLERRGDVEQAYARIRPWVDTGTNHPHLLVTFAQISPRFHREREAVGMLERALQNPALNLNQRLDLHFALGKLYDRLGEYDAAFDHYRRGNELRPGTFDAAKFAYIVDQIIEAYSEEFLARAPRASNASPLPIFIIGMSRSGTSLVEQILASHPAVHGAGELLHVREISASLMTRIGVGLSLPQAMEQLTSAMLDELAQPHLERLHRMSPDALRVTDKMPSNYLSLGLIALLFPGARIIHTKRDPMDSCLSCYFQNFTGGHDYTLRLSDLGAYYVQYSRLMAHWRKVLRMPLLEIQYEDMVNDMERHVRALVDFCGLPWDDRCLRFHENKRQVRTASYDQVREPVYSRSVGRWRHYEKHLGPLIEALGVFAGPPDLI